MGSTNSANRDKLFPQTPYQRLSHSSSLLTQPFLQDQNLFTEMEYEIQAHREKSLALEKEILGLKSSFSRLETIVHTKLQSPISEAKATEGEKQEALIILREKVENLKKTLDGEIIGRVADKRIYSSGFSNQGLTLKRIQEKNNEVDKEISELKTKVDEMASTMVDMAAVIAELKLETFQPNESAQVGIANIYLVLIFLIAFFIGLNL